MKKKKKKESSRDAFTQYTLYIVYDILCHFEFFFVVEKLGILSILHDEMPYQS